MSKCGWGSVPGDMAACTGNKLVAVGTPAPNITMQMAANKAAEGFRSQIASGGMSTGNLPSKNSGWELA